ncbi:MAG: DUF4157 domain-containing protein [Gammaproteobacteria bacterium]|nr:DUF4157 domain-containing protein [Gammaproteobacteria bacterium]
MSTHADKQQRSNRISRQPFFNHQGAKPEKSFISANPVQAKLKVSKPNDPHEVEAEAMADHVVARLATPAFFHTDQTPDSQLHRQSEAEEEEELQTLRRQPEEEEEELQTLRRQPEEEEEELQTLRRQPEEEEEELQTLRRQPEEEEEELQTLRRQPEEEEEELQTLRRQPEEEEEELQTLRRQPEEEEEELQTQPEEDEEAVDRTPKHYRYRSGVPPPFPRAARTFGGSPIHRFRQTPAKIYPSAGLAVNRQRRYRSPRRTLHRSATARGPPEPGPGFRSHLQNSKGAGRPMPATLRQPMESAFQADFSRVRLHTGQRAVSMSRQINAQAFTHGSHIYFGQGRYAPESSAGKHLLAHELTHVVQQGGAVQRRPATPGIQRKAMRSGGRITRAPPSIQRLPGFIGRRLNSYARYIPGYTLLTVIIGYNPLLGQTVARTPRNLLQGFMGLASVLGIRLFAKLTELGIVDAAFNWVNARLQALRLNVGRVERLIQQAYDRMDFLRLDPIAYNRRVLVNTFAPLVRDVRRFAGQLVDKVVELIKNALRSLALGLPGYRLITMIIGSDPLTDAPVIATTAQIIAEFLTLIGATQELAKMREHGALERTAAWIDLQLALLNFTIAEISALFITAWNSFSIQDVFNPVAAFNRVLNIFGPFISRAFRFARNVATTVLSFIKDALLDWLSRHAGSVPGFHLFTVIIGRNPFTQQPVPRTASNFIRGFLGFVPGGEEKFQNLQQSGAIERAMTWLNAQIARLNLTWDMIRALFTQAWNRFSITDLLNPVAAFQRIVTLFRAPVRRIIRFAAAVAEKILEFIFEGVMGAGGARVLAILKRGRDTFMTIINDPVAFIRNLIQAMARGFRQFAGNILTHLRNGLVGWLLGALEGAGLQLPQTFNLQGIISLVLQVLGITYARIRPRLVRLLGEANVSRLETLFGFLRTLVTEGPGAAWQQIVEFIQGNLREIVMGAIRNWVITRVVTAAITRLATMFNPAGAVIQAILAIYNTIMFLIERINQIMAVVNSVLESVSNIAAGRLEQAANYVEQTMARTIPVVISFLARLMGLGGIAGRIRSIIQRIQARVDRAIDRMVDWIARQGRRLLAGGRAVAGRARAAVAGVINWLGFRRRFSADGASHSIYFQRQGNQQRLMIASVPRPAMQFLNEYKVARNNLSGTGQQTKLQKWNQARDHVQNNIVPLAREIQQAQRNNATAAQKEQLRQRMMQQEVQLTNLLRQLLSGERNWGRVREKYRLEGMVGTYASMPRAVSDRITPDHQPQNTVFTHAASLPCFRTNLNPNSSGAQNMQRHAASRTAQGHAINLHHYRHVRGRTYGRSPTGFINNVRSQLDDTQPANLQRRIVVNLIRRELNDDVQQIRREVGSPSNDSIWRDIYQEPQYGTQQERDQLIQQTRGQIRSGQGRIANQDLERFKP